MVTHLGRFEVSLVTQDLAAMRDFYLHLGFELTGGDLSRGWVEMSSGQLRLGIYQGHIDSNQLSFFCGQVEPIAELLRQRGLHDGQITAEQDGTRSVTVRDPEGNRLYFNTLT